MMYGWQPPGWVTSLLVSDARNQKKTGWDQTQDLQNTSHMLLSLSHWAHGRGEAHKLHIAALRGGLGQIPTLMRNNLNVVSSYICSK